MTALDGALIAACAAAVGLASLRWLRVAQREHYLPGSVSVFALRWWRSTPADLALVACGIAGVVACAFVPVVCLVPAAASVGGPLKLGLRGRTSRLAWTRRLATLASLLLLVELAVFLVSAAVGGWRAALVATAALALLVPVAADLALLLAKPLEDALAMRFVRMAKTTLRSVNPTVIAITGSYGKTTTKLYVAHLIAADRSLVASPASYNNRAGLARTVNEHLTPGTEVLVAEMGAYGPGEIAALCEWMTPDVAVITAVGPAHLERFRTLERTLAAKSEITERARVSVLNVDDERLAGLADSLEAAGKLVVRASGSQPREQVAVVPAPDGIELRVAGRRIGVALTGSERPPALSNAACAAAVALELGIPPEEVLARLANLPVPPNRLQRYFAGGGYLVLDDTFNSNPAGARLALARLETAAPAGRRVLVTPGMIELGRTQYDENAALAESAAKVCSDVVFVARTNRAALKAGAARAGRDTTVVLVDRLDQAVDWVRRELGSGDAVLYENDLPDHFP